MVITVTLSSGLTPLKLLAHFLAHGNIKRTLRQQRSGLFFLMIESIVPHPVLGM